MTPAAADLYRCPYTGEPLALEVEERAGADIVRGVLRSASGRAYRIEEGIPRLFLPEDERLTATEAAELAYYDAESADYDAAMDWVFASFYESEDRVRDALLAPLRLAPNQRILEIGCGSCRDSVRIARRLGRSGALFLQDRSVSMLRHGQKRLSQTRDLECSVELFVGNAVALPFPDGYFDGAFHFGALNLFGDVRQALHELARVVRTSGQVVVGDEGLAPWLRNTTYGEILMNSHALYRHDPPLGHLPASARDVEVRWLLGNAFYLIAFTVGEGAPAVDLDLPIPGDRGGTHRSRFAQRRNDERLS